MARRSTWIAMAMAIPATERQIVSTRDRYGDGTEPLVADGRCC